MIPYEILVTSAARPHLLKPTLASLQARVDQPPERILIHDDAVFTDFGPLGRVTAAGDPATDLRWEDTKAAIRDAQEGQIARPILLTHADPPRRLGMALKWLIGNVKTEYVLYSQDDFVTVRDLPIQRALGVMEDHYLHQIRFNKRATLGQKDTWQGVWYKREKIFAGASDRLQPSGLIEAQTLTVADHWYFQTGLWRTSIIRAALDWLTATPERTKIFAACPAEVAINKVMNGEFGRIPGLSVPYPMDALDPSTRAQIQRTFIWGPIGEDRFIRHIGTDPKDQAGDHVRGPLDRTETERAWAEIASYRRRKETS